MKKILLLTLLQANTLMATPQDPNLWLEDIDSERALQWVREQNAAAEKALTQNPAFKQMEADILAVLDSKEKIPYAGKRGDYYYNYWQDDQHPRGIWRRTTLDEYKKSNPQWDNILDLDALNKAENATWVWHGAQCLRPDYRRCLISLSNGGSDADETREYDLEKREFIKDGYYRPAAKGSMSWIDENHVFIQTDFGKDSMSSSGYPREARLWTRGTPLEQAELVYRGKDGDMRVIAWHDSTPGYERDYVVRIIDFYNNELYQRLADGKLVKIDVPDSAEKGVVRNWLIISLREDWTVGDKTYPAGSYLVAKYDDWMAGKRELTALFTPDAHTSLAGSTWTKNYLILETLEDVKTRLTVYDPANHWAQTPLAGVPNIGTASTAAVDADESDQIWLTTSGYTQPTTLALADLARAQQPPETLKTLPAYFDASGLTVEQHFATSDDGTQIPYTIVRPKELKTDGNNPTLLYGYGGFEVALTPGYGGGIGKSWLTRKTASGRSGVYVVANIRGGGEYGPRWHQAALKQNRHKAYEDFAAVARDLTARGIADAQHLGIQGGSNGGLLMGNMLTQYPELFGAIVVQVPLLDMQRYHKLLAGASWMAEYGDPDKPEDWAYLQNYSPYHRFDPAKNYPPVLFTTSTRDDRVHPGHARKMMAKMLAAGKTALYYENTEGGHGGAADNKQRAYMSALAYTFLWNELTKGL